MTSTLKLYRRSSSLHRYPTPSCCWGWVQKDDDDEWEWEEDDPNYVAAAVPSPSVVNTTTTADDVNYGRQSSSSSTTAPPTLPSGTFRPKQSLGQNFLTDGNTVRKILKAFHTDVTAVTTTTTPRGINKNRSNNDDGNTGIPNNTDGIAIVELGPGAGALTGPLIDTYGTDVVQCIEVDERAVRLLKERHPALTVRHQDVLQVNYGEISDVVAFATTTEAEVATQQDVGQQQQQRRPRPPLVCVIGNLPYYITSQILFALADASHDDVGAVVRCATVTMQWEVAQRMVAPTRCKDYGILSVVFQLYADVHVHFKIPPTVFYPQPKVDSALVGLHFIGPTKLRQRLAGVRPADFRRVVTMAFQQRRKTLKNGLKRLVKELYNGNDDDDVHARNLWTVRPALPPCVVQARDNGDDFASTQELCEGWASKRPEELTPGQFVELTRLLFGPKDGIVDDAVPLGNKVWRKLKHGKNV